MRTMGRRLRHVFLRGVTIFIAVGVAVAAGSPQSLSQVFETRYQELLQRVQVGELTPATEEQAKAVWLALRKDIIALDAEVETLKLEVMSQQGERQETAINQLGEKTAQRERRLMQAIQDLDRLAGNDISAIPLVPAAAATNPSGDTPAIDSNQEQQPDGTKTKTQTWDIEIEFAPEDLSKGDME